mmetsp:Transcript_55176/g.142116  ORF Transcript_55176/g.142116 Transcript_55176/m.142116 type:complete len:265 (+) Transcript_55176:1346-2140(+)
MARGLPLTAEYSPLRSKPSRQAWSSRPTPKPGVILAFSRVLSAWKVLGGRSALFEERLRARAPGDSSSRSSLLPPPSPGPSSPRPPRPPAAKSRIIRSASSSLMPNILARSDARTLSMSPPAAIVALTSLRASSREMPSILASSAARASCSSSLLAKPDLTTVVAVSAGRRSRPVSRLLSRSAPVPPLPPVSPPRPAARSCSRLMAASSWASAFALASFRSCSCLACMSFICFLSRSSSLCAVSKSKFFPVRSWVAAMLEPSSP